MKNFIRLCLCLLLLGIFSPGTHADEEAVDCTDPLSYGQSFERLRECRSHTPRYSTFGNVRMRVGAEMMTCEMDNEVNAIRELKIYCTGFEEEFPERISDLEGEVKRAARFIQTTIIQIEPIPFFVSEIFNNDGIAERFFAPAAWTKVKNGLAVVPEELFLENQYSLQPWGGNGELVVLDDYRYQWRGEVKVWLFRSSLTGRASMEKLAETTTELKISLAFDPERANDVSPLGVYATDFEFDRKALIDWVQQQAR